MATYDELTHDDPKATKALIKTRAHGIIKALREECKRQDSLIDDLRKALDELTHEAHAVIELRHKELHRVEHERDAAVLALDRALGVLSYVHTNRPL